MPNPPRKKPTSEAICHSRDLRQGALLLREITRLRCKELEQAFHETPETKLVRNRLLVDHSLGREQSSHKLKDRALISSQRVRKIEATRSH